MIPIPMISWPPETPPHAGHSLDRTTAVPNLKKTEMSLLVALSLKLASAAVESSQAQKVLNGLILAHFSLQLFLICMLAAFELLHQAYSFEFILRFMFSMCNF
jgi:hypothetical protein